MMGRVIAQLRIEANPLGDLLWIEYIHDDGQVYFSQALPSGTTVESAQRMVDAMNNPEAVIVVDDLPPLEAERVKRMIRLQ